jgi:hypothetical protein
LGKYYSAATDSDTHAVIHSISNVDIVASARRFCFIGVTGCDVCISAPESEPE